MLHGLKALLGALRGESLPSTAREQDRIERDLAIYRGCPPWLDKTGGRTMHLGRTVCGELARTALGELTAAASGGAWLERQIEALLPRLGEALSGVLGVGRGMLRLYPTENGVATIGSRDWLDYSVTSTLTLAQQECAGLVARSRGHRRYYAAVLRDGCAVIEKRMDGQITDLARVPYPYEIDRIYTLKFSLLGSKLWMEVDGVKVAEAEDDTYPSGGAGFIVESGAMLADEFIVERLED